MARFDADCDWSICIVVTLESLCEGNGKDRTQQSEPRDGGAGRRDGAEKSARVGSRTPVRAQGHAPTRAHEQTHTHDHLSRVSFSLCNG